MNRMSLLTVLLPLSLGAAESLVVNGNFSQVDPTDARIPLGWERPDGLAVQWTDGPDASGGKAIRMDTSLSEHDVVAQFTKVGLTQWVFPNPTGDAIAATYGLSLYSQAMPVIADTTYRITVRYRGSGGAKVWVRGYGLKGGKERRLYESVGACPAAEKTWEEFTQEFNPTNHTPAVTTMKVMLFAYWPPGVSWFDDVRIEALPLPLPLSLPKPKPSTP